MFVSASHTHMHAHTLICVCTIVPSVCAEAAESVQIRAPLGFARSRDTVPDTVDGRGSLSLPIQLNYTIWQYGVLSPHLYGGNVYRPSHGSSYPSETNATRGAKTTLS